MDFQDVLDSAEGPDRTAATVAWVQGFYSDVSEVPILVGGGALELYTGGAYRTGDVDLVGRVSAIVEEALRAVGFARRGRHWVHSEGQIFIEFPTPDFDQTVRIERIQHGRWIVKVISPEDLLVDRLAAWTFWSSTIDGVNAFLLWREQGAEMDSVLLRERAKRDGVEKALESLRLLAQSRPTIDEVEVWAAKRA